MNLNPREAPSGYYAVLKQDFPQEENICRQCDYRSDCDGLERCMSYTVITIDGRELKRNDGCSVVFKRLPINPTV